MDKPSLNSIWVADSDTLSQCELKHWLEKRAVIERLCQDRIELTLHFKKLHETIPTTILSFAQTGEHLIVDGSKLGHLRGVEVGAATRLCGSHKGIQLVIDAAFSGQVDQNALQSLYLGAPIRIFRLQRREFFRVLTPTLIGPRLSIPQLTMSFEQSRIRAIDLSRGGLGLEIARGVNVEIDDIWRNCVLTLPASGQLEFSLQVRSITSIFLADESTRIRVGCMYKDLHEIHAQMIEQHVLRIQRDQVAKERGWARSESATTVKTVRKLGSV